MAFLILQTSIRLMLEIYPAVPFNFLSVPKVKLIKSNVFYEASENIVLLDAAIFLMFFFLTLDYLRLNFRNEKYKYIMLAISAN